MANLVKRFEQADIQLVDDLTEPTLGNVIKDETCLMFTWGGLAIAAILYIPGAGFISAMAIAYLGYRDVRATCNKESQGSNEYEIDEYEDPPVQAVSALPPSLPNRVLPEAHQPPTSADQIPQSDPEPQYVQSPWGQPRTQPGRYHGEVYESPAQKLEAQKTSVAVAEFRAPNADELLKLPIKQRADEMLTQLKLSGCNLHPYIHDKVIIATGTQRSGKSTIIVLVGILEAALLGKELRYITSDGDIYPVGFSGLANGAEYYGKATAEIRDTQPGQASKIVWIFDEVTKQDTVIKEALWEQLLTGFVKTGASARLITHGTTMKAIGFPAGMAEQVKSEAVIVRALRKADSVGREAAAGLPNGGQHPSGEYRRQELTKEGLQDVKGESLQLPDWLLFDTNEQGHPCYVRSLPRYFPELDARIQGTPPGLYAEPVDPYLNTRANLETLLKNEASHPVQAEVMRDDPSLSANASQFARLVIEHLEAKDLKVISLARLLCDNYAIKSALRQTSDKPDIRAKGKETARELAMECKRLGLLKVDDRGENSVNLSAPPTTLFAGVR